MNPTDYIGSREPRSVRAGRALTAFINTAFIALLAVWLGGHLTERLGPPGNVVGPALIAVAAALAVIATGIRYIRTAQGA